MTMQRLGTAEENLAAEYLQKQGYTILQRNFTIRGAEVDIIAEEGPWLVFVEVKARQSMVAGAPREAVTRAKRRRIAMAALAYLQKTGQPNALVRFDVIEILDAKLSHLKAAFDTSQ